jgi:hypothetical protein
MKFFDTVLYCHWHWLTTPYRLRLPTEAEWNFAATGGEKMRFPSGNFLDPTSIHVNSHEPLGVDAIKPSGPFNIVGLSGNIWEYVSTLWRDNGPVDDSDLELPDLPIGYLTKRWWAADRRVVLGPGEYDWLENVRFVMKGGSYSLAAKYATVDTRIWSSIYNEGSFGGLRTAISAQADPATGSYYPEPSPFINLAGEHLQSISQADLKRIVVDRLMAKVRMNSSVSFCGAGGAMESIVRDRFKS